MRLRQDTITMLQDIRNRFTGGFAIFILVLIGVPFMFFGINYNFIGQGYAAKVDGQEISIGVFENAYRDELNRYTEQGVDVPDEFRTVIREGVLDRLIRQTLVENYVHSSGFRISDKLVTDMIQRNPNFQVDGSFSKDLYYQQLDMSAVDPSRYEASQRVGLRRSQLERGVAASAFVTPSEYRRYLNLYGEQREVTVAQINVAGLADTIEISDADITSYYDERPAGFMSSEVVGLSYVEIRRDDLGARAVVTEEEILLFYEESGSRYEQEERRQARHILIPFGDDEVAAEAQTVELAARIRAGEPFEDLARQHSKDGGTAEKGGDLSLLLQTQLPGILGDTIFSMEVGDVAGPVKSDFGFHIIRLDAVESGGSLPLEQVRAQLIDELRSRKALNVFDDLVRSLSDALFDADDIQAMAETVGIELKTATGFERTGGEPFGTNQAIIDAVFDGRNLEEREISDIIELDANRSVVFQVTNYSAAERKSMDEVRDEIVADMRAERGAIMASEQAAQLETALLAGENLTVAATVFDNVTINHLMIGRQDSEIDPAVGAAVFQARKPQAEIPRVGTTITQDGNYAVFSITAYAPGRPESIPLAERDAAKLRLGGQSGNADFAALVSELRRNGEILKSEDILAQRSLFE